MGYLRWFGAGGGVPQEAGARLVVGYLMCLGYLAWFCSGGGVTQVVLFPVLGYLRRFCPCVGVH